MDNELKHYGVLGMRWGVRKDRKNSSTKRAKKQSRYNKIKKSYLAGKKYVESRFDEDTLILVSDATAYVSAALWIASAFVPGNVSAAMNVGAAVTNMVSIVSDRD